MNWSTKEEYDKRIDRKYKRDANDAMQVCAEATETTLEQVLNDPKLVIETLRISGLLDKPADWSAFWRWASDEVKSEMSKQQKAQTEALYSDTELRRMEIEHAD